MERNCFAITALLVVALYGVQGQSKVAMFLCHMAMSFGVRIICYVCVRKFGVSNKTAGRIITEESEKAISLTRYFHTLKVIEKSYELLK